MTDSTNGNSYAAIGVALQAIGKRFTFALFVLLWVQFLPSTALADGQRTGACPTSSLGSGVTCAQFGVYDSFPSVAQSSITLPFTPNNHNNGFVVGGYTCFAPVSGGGCNTAATSATLSLSDNINTGGETCFAISPGSPFGFVFRGVTIQKNYMWYCPGLPAGVTSITMHCSVTNGCALMSFWIAELSGMCSANPCWDVDAFGSSTSGVNSVTLTTPKTNNSNELIIALFQNVNDEVYSTGAGTTALQNSTSLTNFLGNMLAGNTGDTAGQTYSLVGNWAGATDQGYGTIGAIKSASSEAQCSSESYGGVATCVQAAGAGGPSTNQSSKSISFAPVAGHAVIAAAYQCWDSNCQATGSTTMSISDNVNPSGEACFIPSPHSPFTLVEGGGQQVQKYMWVCPVMPSGVHTITVTCSLANSCNNITIAVSEWTGLATSNPWDVDGGKAGNSPESTATVATSAASHFTNELSYTFLSNSDAEEMTSVAPFVPVQQFYGGNINTALITSGGVPTAQTTWSSAADWNGTIGTIKTLQSVALPSPPTKLIATVQ